ncbi:DUF559 domain-containing protein [Novosphingobium sp.]|uniref:endonuclease domain-containing protein n=1 Tax=Novosphingobium sp. TaxID=1874826 RepID=UPI0026165C9D|nr:DUF559 domain-containing protein [Novosphingobium sp.]
MSFHHPPTPSSEEEGEKKAKALSVQEEGVGGGVSRRQTMLHRAAKMRREPTEPERRLWMALRDSRLGGYKFRRQKIVGHRIFDFFCPAKLLAVEVDGQTHDRERDLLRDEALERTTGITIIRFTNEDIMTNLEGVQTALLVTLQSRPDRWSGGDHHPPAPSSEEEGGKKVKAPSSEEEGGKVTL